MSRARYVPQLFSSRLPNQAVVHELLERTGAKALVFDSNVVNAATSLSILAFRIPPLNDLSGYAHYPLPTPPVVSFIDEIIFIFHTSGTTVGSPTLVPCSAGFINSIISKSSQMYMSSDSAKQDVCTWMYVSDIIFNGAG